MRVSTKRRRKGRRRSAAGLAVHQGRLQTILIPGTVVLLLHDRCLLVVKISSFVDPENMSEVYEALYPSACLF